MGVLSSYPEVIPSQGTIMNMGGFDYIFIGNEWIRRYYEGSFLPPSKTLSVSGIEYNHNANQPLPEIIGEWFDLNELDIEGYKQGDCTCKSPKLTWYHFKRVQKFNDTRHPKTKVRVVTVLAWTEKEYDAPVLLICKIK